MTSNTPGSTLPEVRYSRIWLIVRSAIFWLWMIFVTVLMGVPVIAGALISFPIGYHFALIWLKLNVYGLRVICGVKWQVDGMENIPRTPCIVMSKHQSTWETYFLPMTLPHSVYVAKRSLAWIPIFGWSIAVLGFILIDRKSGRSAIVQMVEQARVRLAQKRWIIIFPEGTRRPVGAEPNYRIGGALVAEQTGVDVLPVATNSGEFWPRFGIYQMARHNYRQFWTTHFNRW